MRTKWECLDSVQIWGVYVPPANYAAYVSIPSLVPLSAAIVLFFGRIWHRAKQTSRRNTFWDVSRD